MKCVSITPILQVNRHLVHTMAPSIVGLSASILLKNNINHILVFPFQENNPNELNILYFPLMSLYVLKAFDKDNKDICMISFDENDKTSKY